MLGNRSEWLPQVAEKDEEEQQYDTLENVVHSMKQDLATPPVTTLTAGVGGATPAAPTKSEPSVVSMFVIFTDPHSCNHIHVTRMFSGQ